MKPAAVLLAALFLAGPVMAEPKQDLTGMEWLEQSGGERMNSVMVAMVVLSQHGVTLGRTRQDYYSAVQGQLIQNPGLYQTTVTNILAKDVYEKEPASRAVLDKLK